MAVTDSIPALRERYADLEDRAGDDLRLGRHRGLHARRHRAIQLIVLTFTFVSGDHCPAA